MKRIHWMRVAIFMGAITFAACSGGSVSDGTGPITPVDTTKPPVGTVQRGAITVHVSVDAADASLASAVGLGLSGLTVRLTPQFSSGVPQSATTGADGSVRFENLLEGVYTASVDHSLTASERAQLPAADQDVAIFAAATTATFTPPQRDMSVSLVASRRGSLVISEIFTYRNPPFLLPYGYGTYMEVFNAADTTIFLDRLLIGQTWSGMHYGRIPDLPCESFNVSARLDPSRLWVSLVISVPGSGQDYPIRPGEAKVIAMDAMNHTAASPLTNQVDLSLADFEQHGDDADIDNPFVPNVLRVEGGSGVFGRGYPVSPGQAYALMLPSAALAPDIGFMQSISAGDHSAWKVPAAMVLDVFSTIVPPTESSSDVCTPWLAPIFERDPAPIGSYDVRIAIRRKSLGFTSTGIELLQRTHTSSRDLERAEPLRRSLLK